MAHENEDDEICRVSLHGACGWSFDICKLIAVDEISFKLKHDTEGRTTITPTVSVCKRSYLMCSRKNYTNNEQQGEIMNASKVPQGLAPTERVERY